jgi:3-oxoacyl-[acyl-carrier protein] reductase
MNILHQTKTLFLTGGHGGIGKVIANEFAEQGYKVIAPTSMELNLSSDESIDTYFTKSVPEVDVLIHCAGINHPQTLEKLDIAQTARVMQINALSFVKIAQFFVPSFKKNKNGHILVVSSVWGFLSKPGRLAYSMSKHALSGLVKTLALELGPFNIKVNAIAPGFVDTPLTWQNNTPDEIDRLIQKVALGRLADPQEIAKAAYFLCSENNTFITGQSLIVDGGFSVGEPEANII